MTAPLESLTLTRALVELRPMAVGDIDALVAAAADRATYAFAFVPNGRAEMAAYVDLALEGRAAGTQLPFVTVRRADDVVVGTTRFSDLTPWAWPLGSARQRTDRPDVVEIGSTWLATSAQRSGINTEAKLLMLAHAFEVWEVHAVRIRTDERNARSRAAIERLGAAFEGVLRADKPGADGSVRDSAYYSILAAEWPGVRARLEGFLAR